MIIFLQRIKERKTYTDEDIDDDEIEGKRTFDLDEKLESKKYNKNFVMIMKGDGKCDVVVDVKIMMTIMMMNFFFISGVINIYIYK